MLASDGVFDALSDQADPRCFADLAASTLEPVEGLSRLSLPTLKSLSFFFSGHDFDDSWNLLDDFRIVWNVDLPCKKIGTWEDFSAVSSISSCLNRKWPTSFGGAWPVGKTPSGGFGHTGLLFRTAYIRASLFHRFMTLLDV